MGLLPFVFVIWRNAREWTPARSVRNRSLRRQFERFIPIPPGSLLFSSTGSRDVEWFLESGQATADAFRDALQSVNRPMESFKDIFELGCGCGRVLRHWVNERGTTITASDYNSHVVSWVQKNLPFVSCKTNMLEPPLPFATGSFDLCYAVSVFTHLPQPLQEPWLKELHRVLRPNGIFLVTLSGEGDLVRTTQDEQNRFNRGELLVLNAELAGTNMCAVYHSKEYVERKWNSYFRILRFIPQGAKGSPRQDLYILERT